MNEVLLKAEGIYKSFGATKAVVDFHIEVCRGTIHGLIGENGSGKSTFSSIVAGIQQRDSGRLLLRGEDYAPTSSVDVCENGYEHHVCFVRGHVADILEEALTKYMGIPVYHHR